MNKKIFLIFLGQNCDLCMFYADWQLGGWKKLKGRDYLNKNLLG